MSRIRIGLEISNFELFKLGLEACENIFPKGSELQSSYKKWVNRLIKLYHAQIHDKDLYIPLTISLYTWVLEGTQFMFQLVKILHGQFDLIIKDNKLTDAQKLVQSEVLMDNIHNAMLGLGCVVHSKEIEEFMKGKNPTTIHEFLDIVSFVKNNSNHITFNQKTVKYDDKIYSEKDFCDEAIRQILEDLRTSCKYFMNVIEKLEQSTQRTFKEPEADTKKRKAQ